MAERALDEKLSLPAVGNETFREGARWERARIRREQAQTIAWMRGCIDRFGDFKQWADRLEEATRDA